MQSIYALFDNIGSKYQNTFVATTIPLENLCDELSVALHLQTFRVATRPVGLKGLIIGWDKQLGLQIYSLEPDGNYAAHNCICIGGHSELDVMNDFANDSVIKTCNQRVLNDVLHSLLLVLKKRFSKYLHHAIIGDDTDEKSELVSGSDTNTSELYEADVVFGRLLDDELTWTFDSSFSLVD